MVNQKRKRLSVSALEPVAREATRKALEHALAEGRPPISPEQDEKLTLGTFIEDDRCVFELYIVGERPKDALIISRAFVDRYTGRLIGEVETYLPPVLDTDLPER